jgi:hypothetical protein
MKQSDNSSPFDTSAFRSGAKTDLSLVRKVSGWPFPISLLTLITLSWMQLMLTSVRAGDLAPSDTAGTVPERNHSQSALESPDLGSALDATNLVWTTGGSAPWFHQTAASHDGLDAAQAGTITGNQVSWLQTIVNGPGTLSFWWQGSFHGGDGLTFLYDDSSDGWSEEPCNGCYIFAPWTRQTYEFGKGTHTFRWIWTNSVGLATGQGRVWLDDVSWTPSSPPESVRPSLTISSPKSGQRWSNSVFTVTGTAKDNVAVSKVWVKLNSGEWTQAVGTTTWTASVGLIPGLNTLNAYAVDTHGNVSATASVSFTYLLSGLLTVEINGTGVLKPNYNDTMLEIGKNYAMTAKPGADGVFSNWMSGTGTVLTNGATLNFTMQSNLTLVANFARNPFAQAAGTYAGLFYETNGVTLTSAGFVSVKVTSGGKFTAKLQQGANSYSLSGQFSASGSWGTDSIQNALEWGISLQLDLSGGDEIFGVVSNSAWTADLIAKRAGYSTDNPAPQAGKYTLIIPGSDDAATRPGGCGFGAVSVSPVGAVTLKGTLGDGTPVTSKTFLSKEGQWPLYAALYGKKGLFIGWLTFTNDLATKSDLEGIANWIKPSQTGTTLYPGGFESGVTRGLEVTGSLWNSGVPPLNWSRGSIVLENGNATLNLTNQITLSADGKATDDAITNKLKLTITMSSGVFKGSLLDPLTQQKTAFNGALLQKQNAGYGFFPHGDKSGPVRLLPEYPGVGQDSVVSGFTKETAKP